MKKSFLCLIILLSFCIILISCGKKEEKVQPFDPSILQNNEGKISGTLNGIRFDNTSFNYDFSWSTVTNGQYTENEDGTYSLYFGRYNHEFPLDDVGSGISFFLYKVNPMENAFLVNNSKGNGTYFFYFIKDIGNNTLFEFARHSPMSSNISFTNFSFNPTTGKLTSDYVIQINAEENTTNNNASILNGKIDVTLKRFTTKLSSE